MSIWLRQSTATTLLIGPFIDDTDGKTAETALTLTSGDFLLWKHGGTTLAAKNESSSGTHRSLGYYTVPVDTTDTNTLGELFVAVHETGALPVRSNFMVVPTDVWDAYFSTARLKTDVVKLNGTAANASNLAQSASVIIQGTSDNTGFTATTTIFESDITEATSDHYKGRVVVFTAGALLGQASAITAYSISTGRGRFTVNALTEVVPNSTTFIIV